jgi:GT2 family glycosyltransferase
VAHFEIFVLNYNGAHYLKECLEALSQITLAKNTATINVIDNASSDNSQKLVTENFPNINFIKLERNLGFSAGNNAGVEIRKKALRKLGKKADYVVFLNNDTAVDKDWLIGPAEVFKREKTVGIVGGKSIFYDAFAVVEINTSPVFMPTDFGSPDSRTLGLRLTEPATGANLKNRKGGNKYLGCYGLEGANRWLSESAKLFFPVADPTVDLDLKITLSSCHPGNQDQIASIIINNDQRVEHTLAANTALDISLKISKEYFATVIQNAGSFLTRSWESGDIGFLEIDRGQYETERDVPCICGVSLFIRSELFESLGGFESYTFAYYEDTDLSLRARLKGWKCVYTPVSRLRHVHCGSGVENSDYFRKNVIYSRLFLASKMMEATSWQDLLNHYKAHAAEEEKRFTQDNNIEDKPFLNAFNNYLKYKPIFFKNRLYEKFKRPSKRLVGLMRD